MTNMKFGFFVGVTYQGLKEIPLLKEAILLAYLLLKEDSAKDFGIGFILAKWCIDVVLMLVAAAQEEMNTHVPNL